MDHTGELVDVTYALDKVECALDAPQLHFHLHILYNPKPSYRVSNTADHKEHLKTNNATLKLLG